MSDSSLPTEIRADVERLLNGTLAADGVRRLEAALLDNSKWQQLFLDYCQLHTDLRLSIASDRALDVAFEGMRPPAAKASSARSLMKRVARLWTKPTPLSMTVAALVVGLLVTSMYFMVPPAFRAMTQREEPDAPSYKFVAQLSGVHEAVWSGDQVAAHLGAHLMVGQRMELLEGLAEITYKSGARVTFEGPATFVVEGDNSALLASGKLVALVPASAVGFIVDAPGAVITDLGTEFGVDVHDDLVEAHVFVGEVLVQAVPRGGSPPGPVRIGAGEAVRIGADGQVQPAPVTDATRFSRRRGFVNLARGKPIVHESASWPGPPKGRDARYVAAHVVDGKTDDSSGSYWIGRYFTPGESFVLDLGSAYGLERIELLQTHNGEANTFGTDEFELWASNSISAEHELIDPRLIASGNLPSAAGTGANLPVFALSVERGDLQPHNARYVRFVAKTYHGKGAGLNEIRVFGSRPK